MAEKVKQLQTPIFAPNTRGAWVLRFDDVLADALELGPLHSPALVFSTEEEREIAEATPDGVPTEVLRTLIGYYILLPPDARRPPTVRKALKRQACTPASCAGESGGDRTEKCP